MNKIILWIVFLITSISFSQERINTPTPKFDNVGLIFKQNYSVKYNYDEEQKKWIEDKKHEFHFKTLQFKSFNNNGKTYYLLIKKHRHSGYRYPYIKEGYVEYDKISALVFTEEEYIKIKKLNTGVSKYEKIEDFKNDFELINKAIFNIEKNNVFKYTYFLLKKENDNKARFLIYESYDKEENYNPEIFKNFYFESDIEKFNFLISI